MVNNNLINNLPEQLKDQLLKWGSFGLLHGITDESLKIKIVNSFEIAENILLNKDEDNKTNNIEVIIFPAIRIMICGVNGGKKLNSNIEINEELIHNFIKYIRECCDIEKYNKHMQNDVIDVEVVLLDSLTSMYITYLNSIK